MPKLTAAQQLELLDLLVEFPGTRTPEQREALLFSLPPQVVNSLDLSGVRDAAIVRMIESLEYWGQLSDGRWATEVMLRNSQRLARDTQFEQRLESIRHVFDLPAAKVELAPVPEQIVSDISYLMAVAFLEAGHLASLAVARVCVPQVFDGVPRMNGDRPSLALGTGWLLAPGLLITNHHVVAARFSGEPPAKADDVQLQARGAQAWFDYVDKDGLAVLTPVKRSYICPNCNTENWYPAHRLREGLVITCCECETRVHFRAGFAIEPINDG